MSQSELRGKRVVLVGAGIFEKLGGGARIGSIVDILRREGAEVELISFLPYGDKLRMETRIDQGVTCHNITFPGGWPRRLKGLLLIAHNVYKILRIGRKADVVWTSCGQMPPNAVSIIAARLARVPVVFDYLDLEIHMREDWFRRFLRQSTMVFTCSHYLRDQAIAYGARDVVYLPCFVNLDKFKQDDEGRATYRAKLGIRDDDILVGYAGVLHSQEGVHVLVDAVARLRKTNPRVKLAVLGVTVPTEAMDDVPTLIRKHGLEGAAQAVPPVVHSEVPKFLSACDVLVTPKLETPVNSATIAIKLVEYMAMERPTVACPVGEVKRIVTDGETGYLAAPGNAQALAEAIGRAADDPEGARSVAKRARARVASEFSSDAVAKVMVAALARVAKGGGR